MKFSWQTLPHPFYCLAPMEGATDAAFRQVVISCGRPDVSFTEFVNVEGLMSTGKRQVERGLLFEPIEQPLIAQIWGLVPENFYQVSQMLVTMGFAGVDINMACPVNAVTRKGTGGALIKNQQLASEIITAVKSGVQGAVPVSVKTRIGYHSFDTENWTSFLLEQGIDALTVHGRTVKEKSDVPAHWDEIGKVVEIRNRMNLKTVIIGNGDVLSLDEARQKVDEFGVDGVMIGRGVFYNPWVFGERNKIQDTRNKTKDERVALLSKHLDLYERLFGDKKPYEPMKRFFKIYIQQFDGAVDLRVRLMESNSFDQARAILDSLT